MVYALGGHAEVVGDVGDVHGGRSLAAGRLGDRERVGCLGQRMQSHDERRTRGTTRPPDSRSPR